jgi:hypothetical protein
MNEVGLGPRFGLNGPEGRSPRVRHSLAVCSPSGTSARAIHIKNKMPGSNFSLRACCFLGRLDRPDVFCLESFGTPSNVEFNRLAFLQAAEAA